MTARPPLEAPVCPFTPYFMYTVDTNKILGLINSNESAVMKSNELSPNEINHNKIYLNDPNYVSTLQCQMILK